MAFVGLKVRDEVKVLWVTAAGEAGMSLSAWVKECVAARLTEKPGVAAARAADALMEVAEAGLVAGAEADVDPGANDGSPPEAKTGGTSVVTAGEQSRSSPATNPERTEAEIAAEIAAARRMISGETFRPDFKPVRKEKKR